LDPPRIASLNQVKSLIAQWESLDRQKQALDEEQASDPRGSVEIAIVSALVGMRAGFKAFCWIHAAKDAIWIMDFLMGVLVAAGVFLLFAFMGKGLLRWWPKKHSSPSTIEKETTTRE
jgi:hypothetical protein